MGRATDLAPRGDQRPTNDACYGAYYGPLAPEIQAYIARIDASQLDGDALARIGEDVCTDPRLSARQREMLIARAAGRNRPAVPMEALNQDAHQAERERRERCQFCLRGTGPGLTASGGRWFDTDALVWRDARARVIPPVPAHEQWHTRTDLVTRTIGGRQYRLCMGCAVAQELHVEQRGAQAARWREQRHEAGQLALDLIGAA